MAKVSFTTELNIKPQRQTFPKLSGLKKDEKVRIQLMNTKDIEMEFVHNLEVPEIEDGQLVLKADGKPKTQYKGSPLSFGDSSILENDGIDPKNCPISKMAKEHPDWVSPPRRKFAMHIIQYRTKPGTTDLAVPYNVEHKIWVFTEKTYTKLQSLQAEWGDLRAHDLYITCENEKFQQFDIQPAPSAKWRENQENGKHTVEVYNQGKKEYPDLALAIGQRKERVWVEKDLKEIEEAWLSISGAASKPSDLASESLEGLLDNSYGKPVSEPASDADDDLLNALGDASGNSGSEEKGGADNFDDLLAGL
jgi:hypothetical protein